MRVRAGTITRVLLVVALAILVNGAHPSVPKQGLSGGSSEQAAPAPSEETQAEGRPVNSEDGAHIDTAWKHEPSSWLWKRFGETVQHPFQAKRDVASVEVPSSDAAAAFANAGLNLAEVEGAPTKVLLGVRGNVAVRASRPHPTAPLIVLHDFLTHDECNQLIAVDQQVRRHHRAAMLGY